MANKKRRRASRKNNRSASGKGKLVVFSVERARQELEKVADSLTERYGFDGLIDDEADEFAAEYDQAVNDIMRPFLLAQDANALGELAIARLSQLLRIDIIDDGVFVDIELSEIMNQLISAFDLGDNEQRAHLLDLLGSHMKDALEESHEWVYNCERDAIEDFICGKFAGDPQFSAEVIELADWNLERIKPIAVDATNEAAVADLARELLVGLGMADEADSALAETDDAEPTNWADLSDKADLFLDYLERGNATYARMHWALARMYAMAGRGDSGDALYEYAKELDVSSSIEALYVIADAYVAQEQPHKAIALLRKHTDAVDVFATSEWDREPPLVDYLLELAWAYYTKVELIGLYRELLLNESYVANFDMYDRDWYPEVIHWYDQLHSMVGDSRWSGMREELLASVSDERKQALLEHEERFRKFHEHIIEVLGDGHSADDLCGEDCSGSRLLPVTYYIRYAEKFAQKAKTQSEYRKIGTALAYAAALCGEFDLAQKTAHKIASRYPRKKALLEKLRMSGFDV